MDYSIKQLSEMLNGRAESVARHLLSNGKRAGHEWKVGSISNKPGASLSVRISGEKAGVWSDFATGNSGDLIDLWVQARKTSLIEAVKEIRQWLGVSHTEFIGGSKNYKRPVINQTQSLTENNDVLAYLTHERKLSLDTLNAFKIEAKGREIIFPSYRDDKLIAVKYLSLDRPNGKKKMRSEADCEQCLFGWQALGNTRMVTLTEGEIDAMTLHQYGIPALSLPFGGGTGSKHAWIENEYDRLAVFDEIYLCLDQDNVGKETAQHLVGRLGAHRCKVVSLPYKDANECLQQCLNSAEIKDHFAAAKSLDPLELKSASHFVNQVIDDFHNNELNAHAIELPWEKTHGKILLRPDELSVITGTNGHGKSQLLGHILLHAMKQGKRVCIASLEIKPKRLLSRLTRQASAMAKPSPEYIQAIHNWYNDKLWIFDLVGTAKSQRLLEVFAYARKRYGVEVFVIDSFMKCGIEEDNYNSQKAFIETLCDFKNQHSCHIMLVIHPSKLQDESRPPGKMDMKGSGAVSDLADNCFTVWRNKNK